MPQKSSTHSHPALSQNQVRTVAVAAICDPKTVIRYLNREKQSGASRERVERALRSTGYAHLCWSEAEAPKERASAPPPPSGAA
jgi:hypothetical protein